MLVVFCEAKYPTERSEGGKEEKKLKSKNVHTKTTKHNSI